MWLAKTRPIYIGRKFFKQGVVDLAWTPDSRTLLAASTDGTVACFQFAAAELGDPVPQDVRPAFPSKYVLDVYQASIRHLSVQNTSLMS